MHIFTSPFLAVQTRSVIHSERKADGINPNRQTENETRVKIKRVEVKSILQRIVTRKRIIEEKTLLKKKESVAKV